MSNPIQDVLAVAEAYQAGTGLSDSRVATIVFNDGKRLKQLRAGADMGCRVAEKALVWFAQNWPIPAEWPPGVEMPEAALESEGGANRGPDTIDTLPEIPVEGAFISALSAYCAAITAHRKTLTEASADVCRAARQAVIEAHLAGARDRAAGLAEALQVCHLPIEIRSHSPEDDRAFASGLPLGVRLKRAFQTMINDDTTEVGTEARARFVERTMVLLDAMAEVEQLGRVAPS